MNSLKSKLCLDFKYEDVKFEGVKINMRNIFENICFPSFLENLFQSIIPMVQLYYLTKFEPEDKNEKFFDLQTFGVALYFNNFLMLTINYIIDAATEKFIKLFQDKKYFELGEIFKTTILLCVLLQIFLYFPIKWIGTSLINFVLIDENTKSYSLVISLCKNINIYICIKFFANFFMCFNKPLSNLIYVFGKKGIILVSSFIQILLNSMYCNYFYKQHLFSNFLTACAVADVLTELGLLLFLFLAQYLTNPYPQAWVNLSLQILDYRKLQEFPNELDLKNWRKFGIFYFLNFWGETLMLLYIFTNFDHMDLFINNYADSWVIKNVRTIIFLSLLKNVFYGFTRLTKRKIIIFLNLVLPQAIKPDYMELFIQRQNKIVLDNKQLFKHLKSKAISAFVLCIINFIFLLTIYFFGFIHIILPRENFKFSGVMALSTNGILNAVNLELLVINKAFKNTKIFQTLSEGYFLLSFLSYIVVISVTTSSPFLVVSLAFGNVYSIYRFYYFILQIDLRMLQLDSLINLSSNKNLKNLGN
jgi:hypothetical protein